LTRSWGRNVRPKRWIPLGLFLVGALISGWLAPPGLVRSWAAFGSSEVISVSGSGALRSSQGLDASSIQAASVPATISLLLLDEDSQRYLPLILR
jgi:hypothetical protein